MHVTRDTYVELMARAGRSITVPATDGGNSTPEGDTEALRHFAGRMRELDQRSLQWRLDRIDLDTLATGLERTYRSGRQTSSEAEHRRTDEALHDWRKQVKYHSFHLILLKAVWPTRPAAIWSGSSISPTFSAVIMILPCCG